MVHLVVACALASVVASFGFAPSAHAGPRELGTSLARDGRCDAALEVLLPLRGTAGGDAEVDRLVGECGIRLERFELAIEALESARKLEPDAQGLDLRLAQAYYHARRLDDAEAALARAATRDASRPELLLYSGLVAFDRGDLDRALERLTAAAALKDPAIEPVASFQLARAQARARDAGSARASYARIVEGWTGTAWADQAARAIAAIDEGEKIPVWASAEAGFESDDNVLIRGRGVGRPQELSGQKDVRGYWFVDTGTLFWRGPRASSGASLRYGGSEHQDLHRFDTQAPGGTLWFDRELTRQKSVLRLQYDFDSAWVGSSSRPFVLSHLVTASLFKPWQASGGVTTIGASLSFDDYRYRRASLDRPDFGTPGCNPCSPLGVHEIGATDRDGFGPIVSVVHRQPLPEPGIGGLTLPWLEGGYRYQHSFTQGREYDHERNQVELGAGIRLPLAIDFSVRGRYAYLLYSHRSVFPDPKDELASGSIAPYFLDPSNRREHEASVRVQLQRSFGKHVLVAARWARTRNYSTADVFDYARDVFGVSVRVGWGG